MTKDALQSRIASYKQDIETLQKRINQDTANLQATQGAIQDAEYWVTYLDTQAANEASKAPQLEKTIGAEQ